MTTTSRLGRLRLRRIAVTVPRGTSPRIAVGQRPSADGDDPTRATPPWSRGLWGTFLPDRRQQRHPLPPGRAERRRASA